MNKPNAGFTALEVIVATAIFSLLIAGFFQMLAIQGKVVSSEIQETDTQTGLVRTLTNILPLLQESRPTNIHNTTDLSDNVYQFRVPMKNLDGSLDIRKNSKGFSQFKFGAGIPGSMIEGGYYEIAFVSGYTGLGGLEENQILESELLAPDSKVGYDINFDGEKDTFLVGTLVLRQFGAPPAGGKTGSLIEERSLGGRICVEVGGTPIFSLPKKDGGKDLELKVVLHCIDIRTDPSEGSRLKKTQTQISLRNGRPPEPPNKVDPVENY